MSFEVKKRKSKLGGEEVVIRRRELKKLSAQRTMGERIEEVVKETGDGDA